MGANLRLRTLFDLERHGFVQVRITCGNRACGWSGTYATQNVAAWFRDTRVSRNAALEVAGSYFRCERCRWRGASIEPVAPSMPPDPPKLEATDAQLRRRAKRER